VRAQVALSLFTDFVNFSQFSPAPHQADAVGVMLDQLVAWSTALARCGPPGSDPVTGAPRGVRHVPGWASAASIRSNTAISVSSSAGHTWSKKYRRTVSHMPGRGGLDRGATRGGDPDQRTARVGGAFLPRHQSALLHPAHLVGEPAAIPAGLGAQLAGPQDALRDLGQGHEPRRSPRRTGPSHGSDRARRRRTARAAESVGVPGVRFALVEPVRIRHTPSLPNIC